MSKQVIIYTTPTCTYCKMAKEYFTKNNISYSEKDVARDETARNEMLDKSGQMGVPVIDVGGQVVVGFYKEKLAELLSIPV